MLSAAPVPLKDSELIPLWKKAIFSGLSGAIATTIIYPIDLVKTRLQNNKSLSPIQVILDIREKGGWLGFYRGWPPAVLLVIPEKAIKLTMNDYLKKVLRERGGYKNLPFYLEMLAGAGAGFCQVIATNPMELLKIQGATKQPGDIQHAGQVTQKMSYPTLIKQLGVSGLYTGVLATLLRDIPFSFVYFPLYSRTKEWLLHDAQGNLWLKALAAGGIAGTIAAAVTCPFDVVKTRVHAAVKPERLPLRQFFSREVTQLQYQYTALVQKEGYRALIKGMVPRCLIISPLFAITMTCYEQFQQKWG